MWYRINLELDSTSLSTIYRDGQYVTMVKHTGSSAAPAGEVTWVAFAPLQRNSISWEDRCAVYASRTPLRASAVVEVLVSLPAEIDQTYLLMDGAFHDGGEGLPGEYCVANADDEQIGVGIAQSANVNSIDTMAPTNVVPLLAGGTVMFAPSEEISVFLAPFRSPGVLLREVPPHALRLRLSPDAPEARIAFDAATQTFRRVCS